MILIADISGERLDAFVARCAEGLTRSAAQKLIEEGHVTRNGKAAKKNDKLNIGDEISVTMPEPNRGDIVAVCTTGAYNYTMASNYNRLGRPPVVMLSGGESYVAVKRETYADVIRNDV